MNDQTKLTEDQQQQIASDQVPSNEKPQPKHKKRDSKKSAKGRFHCECGQSIRHLVDRQSVTCGSCGTVHHGPK